MPRGAGVWPRGAGAWPRGAALIVVVASYFCCPGRLAAEVLVRWDQDSIPSAQSLGISTVVVPAKNTALARNALVQGYRVLLELDASELPAFTPPVKGLAGLVVIGSISPKQLAQARQQLESPAARVISVEAQGKWPHIRTNWVTRNKEVLQVTRSSAQPWIENNAALLRIARAAALETPPLLTYPWQPITLADADEGPSVENYLVAIAEAGAFGGNLLLPLHARFQRNLLLGQPRARSEWNEIRRYIDFYSWPLPGPYRPLANIGIVTSRPAPWHEVMNLLLRHNLPFELLRPNELTTRDLSAFDLLVVLDTPSTQHVESLAQFARKGGTVVLDRRADDSPSAGTAPWRTDPSATKTADRIRYDVGSGRVVEVMKGIADPNAFAFEVRQLLGRERRPIEIWNGITVLAAPYEEPAGKSVLITAVNYAHQALPVQLRIRGTFSVVQYESPEQPVTLLPHQHRNGGTEVVLPSLRVGARIFLAERRD